VLLLLAFAMLAPSLGGPFGAGLIHGLKLVAVAVVAQAVWDMARKLCPDWQRAGIAVLSIAVLGALTTVYAQLVVIALGAALGLVLCRTSLPASGSQRAGQEAAFSVSHVASIVSLALFCALLFGLPVLTDLHP
ncbi:chromate transporter, partial [Klebsiella pneumoniae]|nr:chromate transporter [Klebsiella pneumoniae]